MNPEQHQKSKIFPNRIGFYVFPITPTTNVNYFRNSTSIWGGRDSSVGIAIRYGQDGPEIESRWGRDFPHPSRPVLGPTQPPVQWLPGLSRE